MTNEESEVGRLDSLLKTTITASIFLILGIRIFATVWGDAKSADALYLKFFAIPATYIISYAIFFWAKPHLPSSRFIQGLNKVLMVNLCLTGVVLLFFSISEQLNLLPITIAQSIGSFVNSSMFLTLLILPVIICAGCVISFALSRRAKTQQQIEVEKFKRIVLDMHRGFPSYVYFDLDKSFSKETLKMLEDEGFVLKATLEGRKGHRLGPASVGLVSSWNTENLSYWMMILSIVMLIMAIVQFIW